MKSKKNFKKFILSDKVYDTSFVVFMLSLLAIAFWFAVIQPFLE